MHVAQDRCDTVETGDTLSSRTVIVWSIIVPRMYGGIEVLKILTREFVQESGKQVKVPKPRESRQAEFS